MRPENEALLTEGLSTLGIGADQRSLAAVIRHLEMVADWNQRVNLTAIKDEAGMVVKHAVDSATAVLACRVEAGMRVIDVGTGAGFPGVTMQLLFPDVDMVLLDSLQKRCRFLEAVRDEVVASLGGRGRTQIVWGRAEEVAHRKEFREQCDLAVARAVAELRVLAELCLPFVSIGGRFLAMKGPGGAEEVKSAHKALRILGGEVEDVKSISLPAGAGERTLITVSKTGPTPSEYPRKPGIPERKPL